MKKNFLNLPKNSLLIVFMLSVNFLFPQKDTSAVKKTKSPRHYFMPTVFSNWYASGKRSLHDLQPKKEINKLLKTYAYSQFNTGFYVPLWTKDKIKKDSVTISNWHLLLTGNFLNARPVFEGLDNNHVFAKYSVGLRTMYNNGKKDVFFWDFSPFVAFDKKSTDSRDLRVASIFVWSHIFNEKVSMRLGFARTFIFGDRFTLPYIGFRFGRLDKTYISIQFPRNIYLNVPIVKTMSFNVLAKPMGGVYNYKDVDSLYPGQNKNIIFARKDFCFGIGLDFHPSKYFTCFIQAGATSKRSSIMFISKAYNEANNLAPFKPFYYQELKKSSFLSFGITFRFGRAKNAYGNRNIYELMNLNSDVDPGDNNSGPNSSEIIQGGDIRTINRIKYKDLSDLIDDSDLYD
jgi:hypothetical protein